jgi:farnesol dehydrogenase
MRVLVTGGAGFLGGRIAEELTASGCAVRLLVRRPESLGATDPRVDVRQGDILDAEAVARSLDGCEAVVHAAALVKRWVRDRSLFDRVNVGGAAQMFDLAARAGVGKVLYCSSFLALGPTDGFVGDEDTIHDGKPRNDYERTKKLADELARARQAAGAPLVILYPGVVYGPGRMTDGNILGQAARRVLEGRFPGTIGPGDRRQCLASVEDVARGFRLALQRAAPGSRYVLGGENITVRQALDWIASSAGVPPPRRRIPYGVAAALGAALRWSAGLTGAAPPLTDEEVAIYRHEWAYSSARAARDLGYTITPAREGLEHMVRWLQRS